MSQGKQEIQATTTPTIIVPEEGSIIWRWFPFAEINEMKHVGKKKPCLLIKKIPGGDGLFMPLSGTKDDIFPTIESQNDLASGSLPYKISWCEYTNIVRLKNNPNYKATAVITEKKLEEIRNLLHTFLFKNQCKGN